MTSRLTINGQIDNHGGAGHSARGAARLHRDYRPVRVTPLRWQDTLGCPHLPGTLSPNQLGRGLRAPGPFSFTDRAGVSSHQSAGDRQMALPPAVGRHPFRCGGPRGLSASALPTLKFETTDHQACKLIDPSPFVAHQSAPFVASNHAAKGVSSEQEVFASGARSV